MTAERFLVLVVVSSHVSTDISGRSRDDQFTLDQLFSESDILEVFASHFTTISAQQHGCQKCTSYWKDYYFALGEIDR